MTATTGAPGQHEIQEAVDRALRAGPPPPYEELVALEQTLLVIIADVWTAVAHAGSCSCPGLPVAVGAVHCRGLFMSETVAPLVFVYDRCASRNHRELDMRLMGCHTYANDMGWVLAGGGPWLDRGADALTTKRPKMVVMLDRMRDAAVRREVVCLVHTWGRLRPQTTRTGSCSSSASSGLAAGRSPPSARRTAAAARRWR